MSPDGLRNIIPDQDSVYKTKSENDVADFVYDPFDKRSPDDSVMVIRNGLARFKRVVKDHINLQWYLSEYGTVEDALIAAFSYARNNNQSITLYIPKGRYRIYQTIEFDFGISVTVNIVGEAVSGRGSGSAFIWCGENGGTMFRFRSMFQPRIENIDFFGRDGSGNIAKYLIHFEWVKDGLTSLVSFRKCSFLSVAGKGSACINMNATGPLEITSRQCDESTWEDCYFGGYGYGNSEGLQSSHAVLIGGNNTKNFAFYHNHMIGFSDSIIKGLSGIGQLFSERNVVGTSGIHFDLTAVTTLNSISDYAESLGMILRVGIGSIGWSSYKIECYENHSMNYEGEIKNYPVTHPYMIEGQGDLLIKECTFNSGKYTAKINWIMENGIQPLTAIGCKFFGITRKGMTPFYSSGKPLFTEKIIPQRLVSLNCTGINSDGISVYAIPNKT